MINPNTNITMDEIVIKKITEMRLQNDEGKNMGLVFSNPLFFSNLTENDKVNFKL